jgi:hypothetical protein
VNYYWNFNGTNVAGATATSYALTHLQVTNTGGFTCLISNAFGSVTSSVASLTVIATNYPYAQYVLADHPAGYWRLDETSGVIAHDYVGGNNGFYTNALLGQTGNGLIDPHKAAKFGAVTSTNSYVGGIPFDFGTTNYTSRTNGEFSVEAWVYGGTQTSDAGIISKGAGGGGEQFNLDCGGTSHAFRFFVRDNGGTAHLATSTTLPGSKWHHLVGVCDETNGFVVLYLDGVSNASATITTTAGILDSTNQVTFGSRQSGSGTSFNNQFLGAMEEVAIYNYPLSAAQVLTHFQGATNRAPVFAVNPMTGPAVNAGTAYAASIATNASDPNGDTVIFAKVSGPAWLTVGTGGALSGTPANSDANTNTFVVSARDAGGLSNTASLYIYVNGAPSFMANPFTNPPVMAGQAYAGSLASQATDPNPNDVLTFGKTSGPAWLAVATNGVLSGTPVSAYVGTNSFVLTVADPGGLSGSATMTVVVTAAPAIVPVMTVQGTNLVLNWSGGVGPFQVQMNTNLASPDWQTVITNLSSPTLQVPFTNSAAFYRIVGQ